MQATHAAKARPGWLSLLLGLAVTLSPQAVAAPRRVPLRIIELAKAPRAAEPVTSGIPFPKDQLQSVDHVRLLDHGREVPAQWRVVGRWRPGKSIRWLLVDLQTDLPAEGRRELTLEYGPEVSPSAQPPATVRIHQDDDAYTVDTGAAVLRISRRRFSLFEEVRLADGTVLLPGAEARKPTRGAFLRGVRAMVTRPIPDPANRGNSHLIFVENRAAAGPEDYTVRFLTASGYEVVAAKSGMIGQGQYRKDFLSSDGAIAIARDAWLAYAHPKPGDRYTFRTIPPESSFAAEGVFDSAVIEQGPLRSVIRIRGCFGPPAAPVLEYTAWYHFYAGSGRVKLAWTLENNNHGGRTSTGNANNANIGGVNCVWFDEMTLAMPALSGLGGGQVVLGGAGGRPPVVARVGVALQLYQDSGGGPFWDRYRDAKFHPRPNSYVSFRGWRIYREDTVVAEGDWALGWLDVAGAGGGVTVAVRDFWQNYPKALGVDRDGSIQVGLFPGQYAGDFPFRSGEHKTHEVLFYFHPGAAGKDGNKAIAEGFSHPLRLEPRPQWIAETRALGRLHPLDMTHYRDYEIRNFSTIGVLPPGMRAAASLLSRREQHQFFGWMDYGDVPIDFEAVSGQWGMKYDMDYHMAQQYARTLHPWWWRLFVAGSRHTADIDIHHQPHYPGLHFVKGGVWAHSLHNEPGHKNPHRNYNHFTKDLSFGARGTATLYYFTGNWKVHDACLEIAENALANYMSPQSDPGPPAGNNRMGVRGDACTLNRLLEGYLLSGEERFPQRARWQIRSCAFDGKPAKHRPVSLWSSVFYMMALARYVEMFPDDRPAKSYLLAHLKTLLESVDPSDGIPYTVTPQSDGTVVGRGTCSHYNIMAADALAIGFLYTSDNRYLEAARRCFAYGVKNACWKGGPPTYFHVHSANGAMHGNVFMAVDTALRAGHDPR